jgi:toxin ParE1/3/4
VPAYSVARRAESDLKAIVRFTLKTWGIAQTERYLEDLEKCFQLLADNAEIGHKCDSILPGLRRFEHQKHIIFYLPQEDGVLIVRVLHEQMIPFKSRFE